MTEISSLGTDTSPGNEIALSSDLPQHRIRELSSLMARTMRRIDYLGSFFYDELVFYL